MWAEQERQVLMLFRYMFGEFGFYIVTVNTFAPKSVKSENSRRNPKFNFVKFEKRKVLLKRIWSTDSKGRTTLQVSVVVQIFLWYVNFHTGVFMLMNLRQRKLKIKLVWKITVKPKKNLNHNISIIDSALLGATLWKVCKSMWKPCELGMAPYTKSTTSEKRNLQGTSPHMILQRKIP